MDRSQERDTEKLGHNTVVEEVQQAQKMTHSDVALVVSATALLINICASFSPSFSMSFSESRGL